MHRFADLHRIALLALLGSFSSALCPPGAGAQSLGLAPAPVIRRTPQLVSLEVTPQRVILRDERERQPLVVTGKLSDGNLRDVTAEAAYVVQDPGVARLEGNVVLPSRDGGTTLAVRVGTVRAPPVAVEVKGARASRLVSFVDEVVPSLTRATCNAGACHGTPTGKGGFRLSLQGYAPEFDFAQLALQGGGRRTNRSEVGSSILLLKPMARLPHGGGRRLTPDMPEFAVLTRWIAEGLRRDPEPHPALDKLEVTPPHRTFLFPAKEQQLSVRAIFADGSSRDVSHLVKFSSSDDAIATVSRSGLVTALRRGEVAIQARYQFLVQSVRLTFIEDIPGFKWPNVEPVNEIDRDIFARLKLMRIPPSDLCSDSDFVRRVFLDGIGLLPGPDEARAFLADRRPDRRQRLIESVLARPEFADLWALKWADLLRVNEQTLQERGVRDYHRWLRDSFAADKPLDRLVGELLTATGATSQNPPANFYRAVSDPENWMEVTSQLFMGVRIQCARCHNHPFERWTQDEYYQLAAFFGQVRPRELGRLDRAITLDMSGEVIQPRTGRVMKPKLLGGPSPEIPRGEDRRPVLASWLTSPGNPFFARALANRIWFHVMGRGLVEPVDDFRESNPPTNDALLATLSNRLVADGFKLRPFVRFIMNSRTYQLSARPNRLNADDRFYGSHAVARMLTAEELMDGISSVTGVPEDFEGFTTGIRAVQLPGSRVGSPFLKAFGRPDRNLSCECERERDSNLFQALQMITGRSIDRKIRSPEGRVAALARLEKPFDDKVDELYLAAFSRYPTPPERDAVRKRLAASEGALAALEDTAWVLLNSKEFIFRH